MVMVMCVIIRTAIVQLPKISKAYMKEKKRVTEMKREQVWVFLSGHWLQGQHNTFRDSWELLAIDAPSIYKQLYTSDSCAQLT